MEPDVGILNSPLSTEGQATIDAPAFNDAGTKLKLEAKSVRDASQAFLICTALESDNRARALRIADLAALHDGAPPKSAANQAAKAQSWEANASTLWIAGINGRVSQRLVNAQISQTYVTASALPSNYNDAKTKSDFIRDKFTALVRGWDGNTSFINSTVSETTYQGYSYAVFLDNHTWLPTFFKSDQLYVPNESLQHARDLQYFSVKMDFRLDKFIELFHDEKAAEANGYDIKNCEMAAHRAVPKDPRDDAATTQPRKFSDMITEGSIGMGATSSGMRIVKTWLLFNREYDGQVSVWMLERDNGTKLRFSFKLFKRMQDVLTIYTFEVGNGSVHSSKGLGRKLGALAIMKELFRCGIIDNARMAGLLLLMGDAATLTKAPPKIMAPFMFLDKSISIGEHQFELSADSYKIVDQLIDAWAEQSVGAWLPVQLNDKGKTERTATEATIDARRENEASDIMIRRCLDQDATRIQMQQLRACSDRNIKKARRIYYRLVTDPNVDQEDVYPSDVDECNLMRFLVECFDYGLTDGEIRTWSKSQASAFAHVTEGAIQRGVSAIATKYAGNPNVDQSELVRMDLEGMGGADVSRRLFIPAAQTTNKIEAERKQQIETLAMVQSMIPVQVSPRDQHLLEIPTVIQFLQNVATPTLKNPNAPDAMVKAAELNVNHFGQHLEAATALGQNKDPRFAEYEKFYTEFKKTLGDVVIVREEAMIAQELVAQSIRREGASFIPLDGETPNIPGDFEPAANGGAPGAITAVA